MVIVFLALDSRYFIIHQVNLGTIKQTKRFLNFFDIEKYTRYRPICMDRGTGEKERALLRRTLPQRVQGKVQRVQT